MHIADVTHFLKPDTAMDAEAALRGTTVYLVQVGGRGRAGDSAIAAASRCCWGTRHSAAGPEAKHRSTIYWCMLTRPSSSTASSLSVNPAPSPSIYLLSLVVLYTGCPPCSPAHCMQLQAAGASRPPIRPRLCDRGRSMDGPAHPQHHTAGKTRTLNPET